MEDSSVNKIRPLAPLSLSERIHMLRSKPETKTFVMIAIGCLAIGYFVTVNLFQNESQSRDLTNVEISTTTEKEASETISVYVTGAVKTPGVYELNKESRVIDALKKAGNAVDSADLQNCNLAQKLSDGLMIVIPQKGSEDKSFCSGPVQQNAPLASTGDSGSIAKVNLNTASQAELETLPGVGPATAISIISHRQSNPFKTINDLRKVKGIGEKRFADLKELIAV